MDVMKLLPNLVKFMEKNTERAIRNQRRVIRNAREAQQEAQEKIAAEKALLVVFKKAVAELTKKPKPFKMPKTYCGPDGKRHRLSTIPVAAVRTA